MRRFEATPVLVTGAAGFLGANLVRALLAEGATVHALLRPGGNPWRLAALRDTVECHVADVADAAAVADRVREIAPRLVFHLASKGGHPADRASRLAALRTDVQGTAAVLESLERLSSTRMVHVGSSLEYGSRRVPLREDDVLAPTTARGASKAAAALLCLQRARGEGLPVTVVRPFSVYGPWESRHRLVPTLLTAAIEDRSVDLTGPGIRRDFVHVADVVEGCLLAALAKDVCGEAINLGTGVQHSNEEVVAAVEEAAGRRLSVRPGALQPRPADTGHWVADTTHARELLGWTARHTLRTGIRDSYAWFRDHHEHGGSA
jgi:nucleoside-diphosphate-sugar epimerase